jgi:translation initiation factor 2A
LKVWKVVDDVRQDDATAGTELAERTVVGKFVQKNQTGWNLQYTFDERYCARTVTNEVQFYESGDLGTVWNKLRIEGVSDFALSPGRNHSIAVFVPERKVSLFAKLLWHNSYSCRVNRPLSKSTTYLALPHQLPRRAFTRQKRYSFCGTNWALQY